MNCWYALISLFQLNPISIFSFADIKGFLTDVKPAQLSALDTEYEKNPYEVYQDADPRYLYQFMLIKITYIILCCFSGGFSSSKENC